MEAHQNGDRQGKATHKVAIQVSENDKAQMDLALNNAKNIIEFYKAKENRRDRDRDLWSGADMLRSDTSPVKDRIAPMALRIRT